MPERHLAVEFTTAGPVLHYRAEQGVAEEFALSARRQCLVHRVTLDDNISADMKPLPYQRLFRP
ncbi:hypothetical protein [Nocardia gipuzkoensis]|uniref:hypothetical protein n=1 Tax=Nocardia gipuzkoensis TaxID=2749991 RepID=UPI00237E55B5|nr:hypothetical protein [Nocardia gipuzkoensis]MDE1675273.1 hypothetical protein [Nocardia gipuzkoensis]